MIDTQSRYQVLKPVFVNAMLIDPRSPPPRGVEVIDGHVFVLAPRGLASAALELVADAMAPTPKIAPGDETPSLDRQLEEALGRIDALGKELDAAAAELTTARDEIARLQSENRELAAELETATNGKPKK